MTDFLNLAPGTIVRKGDRRLVVIDCEGFDSIVGQEVGSKRIQRVPIKLLAIDQIPGSSVFVPPELATVDEVEWRKVIKRFETLKPLLAQKGRKELAAVKEAAIALGCHPATIYRWLNAYSKTPRLSVFLRKTRPDKGKKRLTTGQEKVISDAIASKYLTAEKPDAMSVIEEVALNIGSEDLPHANTIRNRLAEVSERTKMEKRRGKKIAAEHFEPIRGSFPGADYPLAVVQIDHTPMDVIVVDEHDRQPIDRPFLTIVIDVFSRMVLGFAIYLEKPSAFTTGLAISHAILPKDEWQKEMQVNVDWSCWGKMRKIHMDNAKEFRGTVIGRACQEHDITVEHRPKGRPQYGGHVERGFRTFMKRTHRLKGTTFSNVAEKAEYDSEGRAVLTRKELERWFTIFIAKYYANKFHRGIKNTPMGRYREGILGTDTQVGIGLPPRVTDPHAFMLDFMPFEHRTVQEYGIVFDGIYYYDDALRYWIHAKNPENPKVARKFLIRFNPRDMREIYFRDPGSNAYLTIPYRDRAHPPVSRWEVLAADKKLRERGYRNVNEALLFEAMLEMREIEEEAERKTKKARRSREKREHQPTMPVRIRKSPISPSQVQKQAQPTESPADDTDDVILPFGGIEEASVDG